MIRCVEFTDVSVDGAMAQLNDHRQRHNIVHDEIVSISSRTPGEEEEVMVLTKEGPKKAKVVVSFFYYGKE